MTPQQTLVIREYIEALSRVVKNSYLTYWAENTNTGLQIVSAGTFTGLLPRKFQLEITDYDAILVTELDMGMPLDPPAVLDAPYTVVVESGVPFDITGTGIQVTATFDSDGVLTIGDKFLVRMNTCSLTLREVVAWEKSRSALARPGVVIYAPETDMDLARAQGYMNDLALVMEFLTDERADDWEGLEEDIGWILNELNRDLTKGGTCWRSTTDKVKKIDGDATNEVGAQIFCTAQYRHATANVAARF